MTTFTFALSDVAILVMGQAGSLDLPKMLFVGMLITNLHNK